MHLRHRASGEHRPSQGVVLRASVLARLLGIRLLRLEADIIIAPAEFGSGAFVDPSWRAVDARALADGTGDLREAVRLLALASRTLDETGRASRWPSTDA